MPRQRIPKVGTMISGREAVGAILVSLVLITVIYIALLAFAPPAPAQTGGGTTGTTAGTTVVAVPRVPAGNVNIDDRGQENVCNQVVNIILEDVQNNDVNNTQYADVDVINRPDDPVGVAEDEVSSDGQAVEVTQEQVVDIDQELNVSPTIVQTCIQQNAGRDAILVIDDGGKHHDRDDGKHHGGNVAGDRVAGERTDVILETIPRKALPNTGGSPVVWAGIVALVALYAAILTWRVRRRGW